eukprot:CAMPEP_0197638446 /NCGR_PEP_ID=MMETSP1338-20131121/13374_1 /TAXON_ID=43686 ORGANISM="Pelagodinium beii, Strain RCC1491" /NCGR_SAMPLE_ID=MMETSP1338 /ASSEMBLY_ACC=CAM_ASM_000754 /LENGTH=521 /DNA_ID=CAMNT_0043211029 /DNA_START=45 /DNA_END=1610 /DNA_ORIENTATION=+
MTTGLTSLFSAILKSRQVVDGLDAKVQALAAEARLERVVFACQMMLVPFAVILLGLLVAKGLLPAMWSDVDVDPMVVGSSGMTTAFFVLSSSLLLTLCPRLVTHRLWTVTHAVATAVFTSTLFFVDSHDEHLYHYSWILIARVFMGMIDGNLWLVTALNVLFGITSGVMSMRFTDDIMSEVPGTVMYEMTVLALSTGMVAAVQNSRYKMLQAMLEAKTARNVRAVGASLLASTCDAVVHLNSSLQIAAESPQLKALLLRGASTSPMEGLHFADLLRDDSEKEKFLEFISRSSQGLSKCPVPLRLRDANGSGVKVHIFHAQGQDVDDHTFHLLGVQEEDPGNQMPVEANDSFDVMSYKEMVHDERLKSLAMQKTLSGLEQPDAQPSSSTSSGSDPNASAIEEEAEEAMIVWFHAQSKHLRISKCSTGFRTLFGPKSRRLIPVLRPVDAEALERFIQQSVNCIINSLDPSKQLFEFAVGSEAVSIRMLVYVDSCSDNAAATNVNSLDILKLHLHDMPRFELSL